LAWSRAVSGDGGRRRPDNPKASSTVRWGNARVSRSGGSGAAEFADLTAYLLSDRASYVTGSAVNLDGGTSPVL
jgi:NAD(P)-dependent dehydrogenase (short-subunit alcohol dehydrogenase family)